MIKMQFKIQHSKFKIVNRLAIAIIILLFSFSELHSQKLQPVSGYGFQWNRGRFTTLLGLPMDTLPVTGTNQGYAWLAIKENIFYYFDTTLTKWMRVAAITTGITQVIGDYGLINV